MRIVALFICVCLFIGISESAVTDTTDLVRVFVFPLDGYSTEGGEAILFTNAKTSDSVVIAAFYGETGRAEYRFVFNKKLIDAKCTVYNYDWQKVYEEHKIEIKSIEKTTLKTSKKEAEHLTTTFSEIREELSKTMPIRQGFAYLDKGDNEKAPSYYDSAIVEFNRALKLDSLSAKAYAGRGRAYLRKGDNKKAVAEFSHSLNLDRYDAITLSNRGRAYARMGDYDKAVADFEAAAKLDPSNKLIQQNLERAKKREKGL
jgi:tetratricopeptide (TPR) repeat protein